MKYFLLLLLLLVFVNSGTIAQIQEDVTEVDSIATSIDCTKAKLAVATALKYATHFIAGRDISRIISLCAVPFVWLDKEIISDFEGLRKKHYETIRLKGRGRVFEVDTVYVQSITEGYSKQNQPVKIYHVKFKLKNPRTSSFVVSVQLSNPPKVVGIDD